MRNYTKHTPKSTPTNTWPLRVYTYACGGWYYTYLNGTEACENSFIRSLATVIKIKLKLKIKAKSMAIKTGADAPACGELPVRRRA